MGIDNVSEVVRRGRLRWFAHVERKSVVDWVSACRGIVVAGDTGRGRSRKTWHDCVKEDMRKLGLQSEDAQNRSAWRTSTGGNRLTRACMDKQT